MKNNLMYYTFYLKFALITIAVWINILYSQIELGSISPNFTAPKCANDENEIFDLYQEAYGDINGGDYKVVWINLFTSW